MPAFFTLAHFIGASLNFCDKLFPAYFFNDFHIKFTAHSVYA
jgi:hypothetical protein